MPEINIRFTKANGFVNARPCSIEKEKKGPHGHWVKKTGTFDSHQKSKKLSS